MIFWCGFDQWTETSFRVCLWQWGWGCFSIRGNTRNRLQKKSISTKLEFPFCHLKFWNLRILQAVWLLGCYFNTIEIRWNDYEIGVKYNIIFYHGGKRWDPEIDWTNIDSSWHNFKQLSFLLWCLRFIFEVFGEEMRILQGKLEEITIKLNGDRDSLLNFTNMVKISSW